MPSAAEMRLLEERWLDSAPGAQGRGDGEDGEDEGGLEDVVWGNMMGFFWAVGGGGWLVREEGVWSRRRQIAVLSGVLINITFGLLRLGG